MLRRPRPLLPRGPRARRRQRRRRRSLRRFLADGGYSEYFVERLIVPQASAVWSAGPGPAVVVPGELPRRVLREPRGLQLTGRPRWRIDHRRIAALRGGAGRSASRPRRARGAGARGSSATPTASTLAWEGGRQSFDEVVLAIHSDQALAMLADPSPAEREVLGAIPYQRNEVVLHTDESLLPRRRRAWASWNFHLMRRARRADDGDLRHEPAAGAAGRAALPASPSTAPRRSTRRRSFARSSTPPVYTLDGVVAQRALGRSAAPPHALLRRVLGLGLPRGRRVSALRVCEALAALERGRERQMRGGRMSASAIYEGWVSPPARSEPRRALVPLPGLDGAARPRRASRALRPPPALVGAAPGPCALPPRRPPRRRRRPACRVARERWWRRGSAAGPPGRSGC